MEILLIGHGESEADILGVHEGRADFPLTEVRESQAIKMADYVTANFPPDMIISSPLRRAKLTAFILQEKTGSELKMDDDLMEFNNGVLAGLAKEKALITYPMPKGGRPIHEPIQGGESELDFRFRSEKVLNKLIYDYKVYKRIAVISHGGLISNLLKGFLNQPNNTCNAFVTGDTGMHLLEIKEGLRIVKFLNNQIHLKWGPLSN
ncbi:histidine phosphatase family protein [Cytobacillus praedii]|uniref:histidine phosphatase family protein n=1 Tax=Cytobacillus praedii TaxID=1742358 RepID=UPI002E1F8244|nr:histidine phosphatase family protein [Cytobacillus praedii]